MELTMTNKAARRPIQDPQMQAKKPAHEGSVVAISFGWRGYFTYFVV
jgi:hypothetical protein